MIPTSEQQVKVHPCWSMGQKCFHLSPITFYSVDILRVAHSFFPFFHAFELTPFFGSYKDNHSRYLSRFCDICFQFCGLHTWEWDCCFIQQPHGWCIKLLNIDSIFPSPTVLACVLRSMPACYVFWP